VGMEGRTTPAVELATAAQVLVKQKGTMAEAVKPCVPSACAHWQPCESSNASSLPCGHKGVLIIHEQHPQPLGCDRRLLSLVGLMQAEGRHVSLLYRRHVPPSEQSPTTAVLARMLGVSDFIETELEHGCLRSPPAIYRFGGRARQISRLVQTGWFDIVLVGVWFWNDPQPAFAELAVPLIRAHAAGDQPFVGLLVDDAHALRAKRLARWETETVVRQVYAQQAASLVPRLRSLYGLADAVMHVSAADQREERRLFASVRGLQWLLLRTPLKEMRTGGKSGTHSGISPLPVRSMPSTTAYIGFLGNGQTATNHQGIQWFLSHCWAQLRAVQPAARLRIVGRPPGTMSNASGIFECDRTRAVFNGGRRCGWAWGTRFASREVENGIDELGFLPSPVMVTEVLTWRVMIVPIRATTGINTKLLVALELGVPLVVTTAAAMPFLLDATPTDDATVSTLTPRRIDHLHASDASNQNSRRNIIPAALLADDASDFVAATIRVQTDGVVWRAASRAALAAYERMEHDDPAANDMAALLQLSCSHRWQPPPPRPNSQRDMLQPTRVDECAVLDAAAACAADK